MRLLVLILLLANLGFYVWAEYLPGIGSTESHIVEQQIQPEAIKVLQAQQVASLAKNSESEKNIACLEWGAFSLADGQRAQEITTALSPSVRITERRQEEVAGWWVFMPPQGNRQAALQKIEEIKRLGITEYFVVQDDPKFRFAISLGIFRTEDAAKNRLEQLRERGVRTAQIGARTTPVNRVSLQIHDVGVEVEQKLSNLLKDYPGTAIGRCEP